MATIDQTNAIPGLEREEPDLWIEDDIPTSRPDEEEEDLQQGHGHHESPLG